MRSLRIIGPGRAGRSLAGALEAVGWTVVDTLGRADDLTQAARGVEVLVIATPDDAIADVAAQVDPTRDTVVLHLSGSLGPDVLAPHARRGALHPLAPLPTPETGVTRLLSGITWAVAGDPVASELVHALGGRPITVSDADRPAYHAAACIAANHVVALMGQVERVAASAGLPPDAFVALTRLTVDDVARLGARRALTGPAARGDWSTLARHRDALGPEERDAYHAGVGLVLQLAADSGVRTTDPVGPSDPLGHTGVDRVGPGVKDGGSRGAAIRGTRERGTRVATHAAVGAGVD